MVPSAEPLMAPPAPVTRYGVPAPITKSVRSERTVTRNSSSQRGLGFGRQLAAGAGALVRGGAHPAQAVEGVERLGLPVERLARTPPGAAWCPRATSRAGRSCGSSRRSRPCRRTSSTTGSRSRAVSPSRRAAAGSASTPTASTVSGGHRASRRPQPRQPQPGGHEQEQREAPQQRRAGVVLGDRDAVEREQRRSGRARAARRAPRRAGQNARAAASTSTARGREQDHQPDPVLVAGVRPVDGADARQPAVELGRPARPSAPGGRSRTGSPAAASASAAATQEGAERRRVQRRPRQARAPAAPRARRERRSRPPPPAPSGTPGAPAPSPPSGRRRRRRGRRTPPPGPAAVLGAPRARAPTAGARQPCAGGGAHAALLLARPRLEPPSGAAGHGERHRGARRRGSSGVTSQPPPAAARTRSRGASPRALTQITAPARRARASGGRVPAACTSASRACSGGPGGHVVRQGRGPAVAGQQQRAAGPAGEVHAQRRRRPDRLVERLLGRRAGWRRGSPAARSRRRR